MVEGIPTLELVHRKSIELNLDMPLINVIYSLVHAKISHQEALKLMMLQKLEEEFPPTFEDLVNEWYKYKCSKSIFMNCKESSFLNE